MAIEIENSDRRTQIMHAARKVFAERGFKEASNREIAGQAGLKSAALIYHYFPSKLDLLRCMVAEQSPAALLEQRKDWLYAQAPKEGLEEIGRTFVSVYASEEARPMIKILLGEAMRNPEFAEVFATIGPLRMLELVSGFLNLHMEAGRLRQMDAHTAARCFIGPFVVTILSRIIWNFPEDPSLSSERLVQDQVDLFLHGMAA